jgi:predicted acetyltransferase
MLLLMSEIVVRRYEPRDSDGFRHVRSVAYRNGETVTADEKLLRDDCIGYVAEVDGEIVAATTVIDMTATKHGTALRCAGLAAVAVVPEKRKAGVGTRMMSQILRLLKEEGFVIASLYPFRASFYRKFGYEFCGTRYLLNVPSQRLPAVAADLTPRLLPYENRSEIYDCYRQFCSRYAGMNLRLTEDQWWRVLGGDTPLKIYVVGDPIEGYIVLRLNSDFWNNQSVKELVFNTGRAYQSLISFFSSLAINKNAMEWREPGDSPFMSSYVDQGTTTTQEHNIMFRILDVPKALQCVKSSGKGQFNFAITDPGLPENDGPWELCFEPSGVSISRSEDADFTLTIGQLTQAFLGEPSLQALKDNFQVAAVPDQALRFFEPQPVYCTDFF